MAEGQLTRPASPVVVVLALAVGVAGAFATSRGSSDGTTFALLDWVVGAAFAGSAARLGRGGWLALLVAGAWYVGSLAGTEGWLGTLGTAAVLAYRAPALHLLARPLLGRVAGVVVLAGYPAVLASARLANPATIALAVLGAVVTAVYLGRLPADRRGYAATRAGFGLLLAAAWLGSTFDWPARPRLAALDLVMIAIALASATARRRTWAAATDLLVDLGPARRNPAPVSAVIGRALGAPHLTVRYRLPDGGWLDELALPAALPPAGTLIVATPDGGQVALVGCPRELVDSELVRAAAHGAALAVADTTALAALRRRAAEVDASRRRLSEVSDSERRELVGRVRAGPVAQLAAVRELLGRLDGANVDADEVSALLRELDTASAEMERLADGLYPAGALTVAIADQIHALAATLVPPARVRVAGPVDELPDELRVLVHLVVAESITNAARHAAGCPASIELGLTSRSLTLRVLDEGPGGAVMRTDGGLEGLADRAALAGGTLRLTSPTGGPTEVRVDVPRAGPTRHQV